MNDLNLLREYVRNSLRQAKKLQKKQMYQERIEEYKLRKTIRKLIREAEEYSHESTGINVLEDLLDTIIPILQSFYSKLGTSDEQRKSFRAHIIKSVQNLLAPVSVMYKAGGTIGKPTQEKPAPPDNELVETEDDIKVKVKGKKGPEADPAFIPLKNDRKEMEKAQADAEKGPNAEDAFVKIAGEDETGRNIALQGFKRVEKQTREAYSLLANQEDRDLFYNYLITNLKLYFDKFEDELQSTVPEPTTAEYEAEKKKKEDSLNAGSVPEQTPEVGAEQPEEIPPEA